MTEAAPHRAASLFILTEAILTFAHTSRTIARFQTS